MDERSCAVYIDESGDLGVNRGSQWFVLAAVIVDTDKEQEIRRVIHSIKQKLDLLTSIHFRKVRDFKKRGYIVKELASCDFTCVYVLCDTRLFNKDRLLTDSLTYGYICRYLLERVSWFLRDTGRTGKIVLSSRGTSKDAELKRYICDKLLLYKEDRIASDRFTGVECQQAHLWDMLQLADVCATSMFYAYEDNGYGMVTPCFAYRLSDKIYRHHGQILSYGIKFVTDDMKPDLDALKAMRPCGRAQKNCSIE